jgi:hypothetical protein
MTNRNPKRPPGSYRAPSTNGSREAAAPRPRGLSGMLRARQPIDTPMPKITASLARGFVAVLSSPALLVAVPVGIVLEWLVVIALGFQGPFSVFANALSLPPIGTLFDASISTGIFGGQAGLIYIIGFVAFRALLMAILTVAVVQILDEGGVSASSVPRGLRILPVTLAAGFMNMGIVTLSGVLSSVFLQLGGIGFLLQIAGMVVGLYLFVFAPVMAAAEGRSMAESLSRGIRAARIPGAGNLLMASLYIIPSVAEWLAPGKPGSLLGVNPTVGAWVFVIVTNLLHLVFTATFAFRYLSISDDVPDAPEPRARPQRRH